MRLPRYRGPWGVLMTRWILIALVLATVGGPLARSANAAGDEYPHGDFEDDCSKCHSEEGWVPAVIDPVFREREHPFPLRQAHDLPSCRACHESLEFRRASPDCVGCHVDPHNNELGTDCSRCHVPRTFIDRRRMQRDHHLTRFPLRGTHRALDCEECHPPDSPDNLRWVGTPTECVSCHEAEYLATTEPDHRMVGFSTECDDCHAPSVWNAARFDHDSLFPIYSGRHRNLWNDCSTCHIAPGDFSQFSCLGCHPHSDQAETTDHHREVPGFVYRSQDCYRCHPRGEADD